MRLTLVTRTMTKDRFILRPDRYRCPCAFASTEMRGQFRLSDTIRKFLRVVAAMEGVCGGAGRGWREHQAVGG